MRIALVVSMFIGLFILNSCGVHDANQSSLKEITSETSAANLPEGTVFKLKEDLNLLPWSTATKIVEQVNGVGLEVFLTYPAEGSDRILKKDISLVLKSVMPSNNLYLKVETPNGKPFAIRTFFKENSAIYAGRYPTLGELKNAFAGIEIPTGPIPVE